MTINIVPVSKQDVARILKLDETHFVDVKSIDIAPARLTKTLSAFANADGGELFIGIDEGKSRQTRFWRGYLTRKSNGHIQIFDSLFPLGGDFSYEFLAAAQPASGLVLHITVQKTREIKTSSGGKAYVRRNAANQPVESPEALKRLERNKGLTSFETRPCKRHLI